jgi:hypothetical protein
LKLSPLQIIKSFFEPKDTREILYTTDALESTLYRDVPNLRIINKLSDLQIGEMYIQKKGKLFYVYKLVELGTARFVSKKPELYSAIFIIRKIKHDKRNYK